MIPSSSRRLGHRLSQAVLRRSFHGRRKSKNPVNVPKALIANLPKYKVENPLTPPNDPDAIERNPVTSAHAIDTAQAQISTQDSVAVSPAGSVVHGIYGDLGAAAEGIPLEYLALLRMAAEGAAAVRSVTSGKDKGTVLIMGASQASGMAAMQLAKDAGHAVVAVVGSEHSFSNDMLEYMKAMVPEPGVSVAEEYAISKKNFSNLVNGVCTGDESLSCYSAEEQLEDFKTNFVAYTEMYPETLPAAVDASNMKFVGMEKDKDEFRANMEAYLSQFPPGAPPVDPSQLEAYFTAEQYEAFRLKFWEQTTKVISGDESHFFSPPHIVQDLMKEPEKVDKTMHDTSFPAVPYNFTHLNGFYAEGTQAEAGGPVLGAIIVVTPNLEIAAKAVDAAKGLRAKAEAMQFLTSTQRASFHAACSVASQATKAGAPVVVVGGKRENLEG